MATTPTTNYGFLKITPGTEKDIWGPIQSTTLDSIDTQIKLRQNEAAACVLKAGDTMTGRLNLPASTSGGIAAASMRIPNGVAPSSPTAGDIWTVSGVIQYRSGGVTTSLLTLLGWTGSLPGGTLALTNDLTAVNVTASGTVAGVAGTFTGKVTTPASASGGAGLILPHGAAPSVPVNGDLWTTTGGLFLRANAVTVQFSIVGHTHAESDITGLVSDLASKGNAVITPNSQTGAGTYTLVLTDAQKIIQRSNAAANTITVPLNSSVAFPVGTWIDILRYGAGTTTLVATGGVTIRSAGGLLGLASQYSGGTLVKIGTDEWAYFGDLG
jgi:hypothetical protein